MALVGHHVAQELACLRGLDDGGMVAALHGLERILQVSRRVALAGADGHTVTKDLAASVLHAVGGFNRTACFDFAQALQQLGRFNRAYWAPAQRGESILLKPDARAL